MPSEQPTDSSTQTDNAGPQEVHEYLSFIMRGGDRNNSVKQSDRVVAAAGLTNYFLAAEIAGMVNFLMQPPEFFQPEPETPQGLVPE